ncbi:magnesium transporter MRS2-1-like protein, partial [Tanacetum coccineum]
SSGVEKGSVQVLYLRTNTAYSTNEYGVLDFLLDTEHVFIPRSNTAYSISEYGVLVTVHRRNWKESDELVDMILEDMWQKAYNEPDVAKVIVMSSIDEDLSADEEIVLRRHIILRHTDEEQLQATSTSRCYRKGSMTGCVLFIRARDAPAQVDQYVRKPIKSLVTLISCVLALRAVIAPDVDVGSSSTNRMLRPIRRIQDFDEVKDHCLTYKNTLYPHQRYAVYNTLVNKEEPTGFTSIRCKGVCFEESLELLERMSGISPNNETFLILLGKFLQLNEAEIALKIWVKMKEHKVLPDSAHFMIMVEGLGKHGLTFKAKELRDEMLSIGIKEDPKLTKLFKDLLQKDEVKEIKKQKYVKRESRGAGKGVCFEESLELLERMVKSGNGPNSETFLILLGKFLQSNEAEIALKIWKDEVKEIKKQKYVKSESRGAGSAYVEEIVPKWMEKPIEWNGLSQRLVFGAIVYYIWQERNARLFRDSIRSRGSFQYYGWKTVGFWECNLGIIIRKGLFDLGVIRGVWISLPCFVAVCLTLLDVLPAYGLCKGNGIKWFLHDFMNSAIGFTYGGMFQNIFDMVSLYLTSIMGDLKERLLPKPASALNLGGDASNRPFASFRQPFLGVDALGLKKRGQGLRSWIRVDAATGDSQIIEIDKFTVMRRSDLPAPDEVLLLNSLDSYVLQYVVELQRRLKASGANEVWQSDASDLNRWKGSRDSGDVSRNASSDYLPFEFKALEIALEAACTFLDTQAAELEIEAYPLLDELTSTISTLNLERVRRLKSRLVALTRRVQKVRDEIEQLMDDDGDMAEMYLTEKKTRMDTLSYGGDQSISGYRLSDGPHTVSAPVSPVSSPPDFRKLEKSFSFARSRHESMRSSESTAQNIEEMEMLLEAYFVVIDSTLNKLTSLKEYIDDTEDFINIQLVRLLLSRSLSLCDDLVSLENGSKILNLVDTLPKGRGGTMDNVRNQLIQFELLLTTATFVVAIFGVVAGIFGMNFPITLFDNPSAFEWVLLITGVTGLVLFCSFLWFYKSRRVMPF